MFDVWLGEIDLTALIAIAGTAVVLSVQLLLCFRVKRLFVRLVPAAILFVLTAWLVVMCFFRSGLAGLAYVVFAVYSAFLLAVCALGWGIWAVISYIKRKHKKEL